jgi:hypothetical protein
MANADITRLTNNAMTRLPGATLAVIQQELFMVMNDFFQTSNLWNEDIEVPVPGGDPAGTVYLLASQQPANIDKLLWVYTKPTDTSMSRGSPVAAAMSVPGELTLQLQPSSPVTYIVTVALTVDDPTGRDGYVQFPAWVLGKYNDEILDGLMQRMMSQPNKPYTNLQMSVYHGRKYSSGVAQARVDWTRNNTYRQQAWRFPGMVGGSQKGRSSNWAPPQ